MVSSLFATAGGTRIVISVRIYSYIFRYIIYTTEERSELLLIKNILEALFFRLLP